MEAIWAALISAAGVLGAAVVSYLVARSRTRTTEKQLAEEVSSRLHELEQSQLLELTRKRLEVYPDLYAAISDYGRSWELRGKRFDRRWADEFLEALLACNSRAGVFFSDDVYEAYGSLRDQVEWIRDNTAHDDEADEHHVNEVLAIIRNKFDGRGLATFMKDDCGGFRLGSLSVRPTGDNVRRYKRALGVG